MKSNPEILFDWTLPQEIKEYTFKETRKRNRRLIPRLIIGTFIFVLLLLIPTLLILYKCGAEGAEQIPILIKTSLMGGIAAVGFHAFILILDAYWIKFKPLKYQITADHLYLPSDKVPKISWKDAMFIDTAADENLTQYNHLRLFYKKRKRSIPLPKGHMSNEIIDFAKENAQLPKDDSLIKDITIMPEQKRLLLTLCGIYIVISLAIFYYRKTIFPYESFFFFTCITWIFGTLFWGPGTFGMYYYYRSLYFRRHDLQKQALGYNLLAYILTAAYPIIYLIIRVGHSYYDTFKSL